jgi:hypothetical protein
MRRPGPGAGIPHLPIDYSHRLQDLRT